MNLALVLSSAGLLAASGIPGLAMDRKSSLGQTLATLLMLAGACCGLGGIAGVLAGGGGASLDRPWLLPWGRFAVGLDALGAFFLAPVLVVPVVGSIYGQAYWRQADHSDNGRKLRLFYGLLAGAMTMVVLARDSVLFLIAWEIMAVSAFFVATTEDDDPATCRAGWIYLVCTHLGTLCLLAAFAWLRKAAGSFSLDESVFSSLGPQDASIVFVLALFGFGLKAGLMPLHLWLPGAHANAPSHVSAVLSGVMLKMGIFGLVRVAGLLPHPERWWGGLLLALGGISAVLGIAFALGQGDLKRTLAYSSIENIGIIAMGLGLALAGRSGGRPLWIAFGLGGAMLHVWNHSLIKPLLFFAAGAVIHGARTRETNRLGGLARTMPRTAMLFAVGAIALCALPPLNGFVSEWLIYLGLFRSAFDGARGPSWALASFAAPVLALAGALSVACFVGLLGSIFLGHPRSDAGRQAHDPALPMLASMGILAAGCVFLGVGSGWVLPVLDRVTAAWMGTPPGIQDSLARAAPIGWVSAANAGLAAFLLLTGGWIARRRRSDAALTWDCGYAAPSPRMEYTASSFADFLVRLFGWALWPRRHRPAVTGLFPPSASFKSRVPDTVLDRAVLPAFRLSARLLPWVRILQGGKIQAYILYFLIILVLLFLWGPKP